MNKLVFQNSITLNKPILLTSGKYCTIGYFTETSKTQTIPVSFSDLTSSKAVILSCMYMHCMYFCMYCSVVLYQFEH